MDELIARTRSVRADAGAPRGGAICWLGVALAVIALAAFVICAFAEQTLFGPDALPRPWSILAFGGLMTVFVLGCYLAVPLFVPEEPESAAAAEAGSIELSWIHRVFGNGWSWLALYVGAAILVVVLYIV